MRQTAAFGVHMTAAAAGRGGAVHDPPRSKTGPGRGSLCFVRLVAAKGDFLSSPRGGWRVGKCKRRAACSDGQMQAQGGVQK